MVNTIIYNNLKFYFELCKKLRSYYQVISIILNQIMITFLMNRNHNNKCKKINMFIMKNYLL